MKTIRTEITNLGELREFINSLAGLPDDASIFTSAADYQKNGLVNVTATFFGAEGDSPAFVVIDEIGRIADEE